MSFMIAEPTIAPSEISAIFFACSGEEMPKPIAQGISVFSLTTLTAMSLASTKQIWAAKLIMRYALETVT